MVLVVVLVLVVVDVVVVGVSVEMISGLRISGLRIASRELRQSSKSKVTSNTRIRPINRNHTLTLITV